MKKHKGRPKKKFVFKQMASGCIEITSHSALSHNGYCLFAVNGKTVRAHRHIYEQCFGPIEGGNVILHSCNNRACVNPEHLRQGTILENIQDRQEQERQSRGETHGQARLKNEEVFEILRFRNLISVKEIAALYNVSEASIYNICTGVTWSWLTGIEKQQPSRTKTTKQGVEHNG